MRYVGIPQPPLGYRIEWIQRARLLGVLCVRGGKRLNELDVRFGHRID